MSRLCQIQDKLNAICAKLNAADKINQLSVERYSSKHIFTIKRNRGRDDAPNLYCVRVKKNGTLIGEVAFDGNDMGVPIELAGIPDALKATIRRQDTLNALADEYGSDDLEETDPGLSPYL